MKKRNRPQKSGAWRATQATTRRARRTKLLIAVVGVLLLVGAVLGVATLMHDDQDDIRAEARQTLQGFMQSDDRALEFTGTMRTVHGVQFEVSGAVNTENQAAFSTLLVDGQAQGKLANAGKANGSWVYATPLLWPALGVEGGDTYEGWASVRPTVIITGVPYSLGEIDVLLQGKADSVRSDGAVVYNIDGQEIAIKPTVVNHRDEGEESSTDRPALMIDNGESVLTFLNANAMTVEGIDMAVEDASRSRASISDEGSVLRLAPPAGAQPLAPAPEPVPEPAPAP